LLVIGYGAKIRWVAMRVKAENRMVTLRKYYRESYLGSCFSISRKKEYLLNISDYYTTLFHNLISG